jgi:ribose transport system permease protein
MVAGPPSNAVEPASLGLGSSPIAPEAPNGRGRLTGSLRVPRFSAIWVATALLFAVSPLIAPGSVSSSALLSTLPFAAILAIAGIGQTLVVQQRGLDLSVPGMITLTTIIVTRYPHGHEGRLVGAIGLIVLACVASGLISGIVITWLSVTPLVATLGVNALLIGVVLQITSGASTSSAPPGLARFALDKTLGIPNTVIIAVIVVGLVAAFIRTTVMGRRFVFAGANPAAAYAAGIRVRTYVLSTYVLASIAYGGAGILVAGFLGTPGIAAGDSYLLPTIAAVVLGGTSLAGGTGSVVATAIGALFLTQLEQVVLGSGASASGQFIIQGAIVALGMGIRNIPRRRLKDFIARLSPSGSPGADDPRQAAERTDAPVAPRDSQLDRGPRRSI